MDYKMIPANGYNQEISRVKNHFIRFFGETSNSILNISPASIILVGDHTHYNEGILISACIDKYWIFLMRRRKDQEINIVSTESASVLKLKLDKLKEDKTESFRFLKGLIRILKEENLLFNGFDCVVSSTVPNCIGLGSSASQQVGFLNIIRKLFALDVDDEKLLNYVRRNELNLIGKISNIVHHYTVQFGKEKKIFCMDLRDKTYKTVSLNKDNFSLVICDTGKIIVNPEITCNERIEECEIGIKGLRLYIWGIKSLRDVKMDFLQRHYHMLPRKIFNRVLYNVKERTLAEEAIKHLRKKSLIDFGKVIYQSHYNLSEDYELKNELCDFLVNEASRFKGVYGAKMISCSPVRSTFNLVSNDKLEYFLKNIKKSFEENYHTQLKTYVVKLTGGARKISLNKMEFSLQ